MNIEIKNKNVLFPIGAVAKLFGVSVATIRLYEAEGLLISQKSKGKHRQFSEADIKRLQCIRHMIEEQGLNLAGIRMMLSAIPCWELKPCSEADRSNCDAYNSSSKPCWIVENKGDICKNENCRECSVYLNAADCSNLKEILIKYWRKESHVTAD